MIRICDFYKIIICDPIIKIYKILEKSNHKDVIFLKKINVLKNHGNETQKIHESEKNVYF